MSAIGLTDDRRITIDLAWLLNALSVEQKRELVDSLACEDSVIEDVSAQLLTGWTERSSCGAYTSGDAEPSTPLSRARRLLANRASDVAANEIAYLVRQLKWQKQLTDHYSDAYYKLQAAWPCSHLMAMPRMPSVPIGDPSLYSVTKIGGVE